MRGAFTEKPGLAGQHGGDAGPVFIRHRVGKGNRRGGIGSKLRACAEQHAGDGVGGVGDGVQILRGAERLEERIGTAALADIQNHDAAGLEQGGQQGIKMFDLGGIAKQAGAGDQISAAQGGGVGDNAHMVGGHACGDQGVLQWGGISPLPDGAGGIQLHQINGAAEPLIGRKCEARCGAAQIRQDGHGRQAKLIKQGMIGGQGHAS